MRYAVVMLGASLWLLSAGTASAAEESPIEQPAASTGIVQDPTQLVRAQIQHMLADPLSQEAVQAQSAVVEFAKQSDQVFITISQKFFKFTETSYDSLLMAHYLAGATLFDLDHPTQAQEELADVPAALAATATMYRALRAKDATFQHPFFDAIDARAQQGELEQLVQELNAAPADANAAPADIDVN